MISEQVIQAVPRDEVGKNASRRLRAAGRVPAIVYGGDGAPLSVSVVARELGAILRSEAGRNTIFTLDVDGHESTAVMIKHIDVDPVTYYVRHTDLVRVTMSKKTRVAVPIEFTGESAGMKLGGKLEIHLHALEIECLPRDIPEKLTFDVTNLQLGEQVTAGQIPVDEDAVTILHPDYLVAVLHAPHGAAESAPAEEPPAE
jgi:large subunit ribosomal protein L25